jgi:hypothetical protein
MDGSNHILIGENCIEVYYVCELINFVNSLIGREHWYWEGGLLVGRPHYVVSTRPAHPRLGARQEAKESNQHLRLIACFRFPYDVFSS